MTQSGKSRQPLLLIKRRLIPAGSRREQTWVEIRQLARLVGRDGWTGVRQYLNLKLQGQALMFPAWWLSHTINPVQNHWHPFWQALDRRSVAGVVIIYAATPYHTTEGQRSTWLARAFLRAGWVVIYGYWRWSPAEREIENLENGRLLQLPLDELWAQANDILTDPGFKNIHRLFLAEFPHPSLFNVINVANASGWLTLYDRIDDWPAFHKNGQAAWYDPDFETYLVKNVMRCSVTASAMDDVLLAWTDQPILHVPNAYEPGSFSFQPVRGVQDTPFTVGYFGHLTAAWFDWSLVIHLAENHPDWKIELIGPGTPPGQLPANITLTGRLPHAELAQHAVKWHVAIIPFISGELSHAVDPIKVYEYLALGRPVVASGMPHLSQMPYVYIAQSAHEFEQQIERAATLPLDERVIASFLSENNWDHRVKQILDEMQPLSGNWMSASSRTGGR